MAKLSLKAGTTSKSVLVFIQDSSVTTGAGLTGLAFNSGSLVASYAFPGAARVAITLATQTVTGAFSSGGFVEVDATNMPGVYRLDIPNAALAAGTSVVIMLKGATNMAPCLLEIELTATDNQTAVTAANLTQVNGSATVDGITPASLGELLIAFIDGKVAVTGSGATRVLTYKKQDGSTTKFSIEPAIADGSRAATGTII